MSDGHVVVAGGAGFIGSHLCERLVERGDRVTCLDDLSTGARANLEEIRDHERFRFVEIDVVDPTIADLDLDDVTAVMHLASPASPPEFLRRPFDTLAVNSRGTEHLLEIARRHGARFFLASTSEVYGDPLVHPQPEHYHGNVNPVGPRAVYDEAKRFAEALTMAYHREHGLDVCIVRIFNTYGPRMQPDDGRVITNFVNQALTGAPITVYGEGHQTRSFCYVDDEVRGFLALLDSEQTGPINIGNPSEFTMLELADLVIELTGSSSEVVHQQLPVDDPKVRQPDITLATELLGWAPEIDLRDGLMRTIDWFRSGRQ